MKADRTVPTLKNYLLMRGDHTERSAGKEVRVERVSRLGYGEETVG